MSAAFAALTRIFPLKVWLAIAAGVAVLALVLAIYLTGRGDEREAQADRTHKVETKAAAGRETAAGERAAETRVNTQRLEDWNHEAEQTPDNAPDARDLRRRCRQLRDAGGDFPACRGLEGGGQAGPAG